MECTSLQQERTHNGGQHQSGRNLSGNTSSVGSKNDRSGSGVSNVRISNHSGNSSGCSNHRSRIVNGSNGFNGGRLRSRSRCGGGGSGSQDSDRTLVDGDIVNDSRVDSTVSLSTGHRDHGKKEGKDSELHCCFLLRKVSVSEGVDGVENSLELKSFER